MSKVVDAVSNVFGAVTGMISPEIPEARNVSRNASQIGAAPTAAQLAERRAAMAASGRRLKEEEVDQMKYPASRPLQGSRSNMWS